MVTALNRLAALCLFTGVALAPPAFADDAATALKQRYEALRPQLENSLFGVPLAVESAEQDGLMRGEVYGVLAQPYARLALALQAPRAWCAIALLHLNIKTCTHERRDGQDWLTFYSGRKFYEPPEKAYALRYAFRPDPAQSGYLGASLTAASGPLGTRDYRIRFEAIPLGQQTFVHFRYAYRPSLTSSLATGGYLATLGSGKAGFTVVGRGRDGKPEYIGGVHGIVERNAMRYYLAIQAWLETVDAPAEQRFERWFDLTERYPAQLHELEKQEYLQYKFKEQRQQDEHQRALDAAISRSEGNVPGLFMDIRSNGLEPYPVAGPPRALRDSVSESERKLAVSGRPFPA